MRLKVASFTVPVGHSCRDTEIANSVDSLQSSSLHIVQITKQEEKATSVGQLAQMAQSFTVGRDRRKQEHMSQPRPSPGRTILERGGISLECGGE